MQRRLIPIAVIGLAVLAADLAGGLRPLDGFLTGLRMRATLRPPSGRVVVADIDAKSLAAIGRWPWPRSIHARLIDRLVASQAGEIALDIDFSAASTPVEDAALEAALENAGGGVILAAFEQRSTAGADSTVTYNEPIPQFARHAWIGRVNVRLDPDGQVRRFDYAERVKGAPVLSIPALLGGKSGANGSEFLIDFGIDAAAIDRIPVIDILDGRVAPGRIADKKVIVGAEAAELRDFFQAPVYGTIAGVMVQALATESILQNRTLARPGDALTWLGLAVLAGLFLAGLGRVRWMATIAALALAALAVEGAATAVQWLWPIALHTAPWHVALAGFAVLALVREIDFRRILLLISRNQTRNIQTILDRIVDDNFAGVLVVDEETTVRAASRAAEQILQVSSLVGRKAADALPSEFVEAMRDAIAARRAGTWTGHGMEEIAIRADGDEPRVLEYVVTPSRLAGGVTVEGGAIADTHVACLTFSDVTERRRAAARMEILARFDTLTGLPNRNQFMERLEAALQAVRTDGRPCAVVCFDLDRFKDVNDTLGHRVGDLLLSAVARRVESLLAEGDLVARFGGDDFGLVLTGTGAEARAAALAERLIARIGEPFRLDSHRLISGLSIGIAVAGGDVKDAQVLLKQADTALYRAKESGGNRWMSFEAAMIAGVESRQELELALWEALERDQFEVFYQPQVDLADGRIVGVEALIRWKHPERGYIPPMEFVPIAEAVGLIRPLGEWVLRTACAEVAGWSVPLKLAVNVSSVQFRRGDLVGAVKDALARSGLPATRLELEITESLFVEDSERASSILAALIETGVRVALDDFGTGYSSLGYISKFPVHKIKLDRSFVAGIPGDRRLAAIVQSVVSLARSIGIRLNAEGIEEAEQAAYLRLLGCHEGQGYLFGKPMPAHALSALLAKGGTELTRLRA